MALRLQGVIDLETFDKGPDAAIMSIGLRIWDPNRQTVVVDREFKLLAQPERSYGKETLEWWGRPENRAALEENLKGPHMELETALREIDRLIKHYNVSRIWACDPDFDLVILKDALLSFDMEEWPFWRNRSIRTLEDLFFGLNPRREGGVLYDEDLKHNALADCILESRVVTEVAGFLKTLESSSTNPLHQSMLSRLKNWS